MRKEKLPRREREKLWHRQQMLAVALDLFSKKGYYNVSMHEIAKKAEFAIGTLYKFFRNKEDLYKALMREKVTDYHHTLSKVLSQDKDVLTILKNYISAKASIFTNDIATLRLYFAETRGASFNIKAGLDRDIRKLYDELMEQLTATMERGIREKVLRNFTPYYMAVALEGLTNAFLLCWMESPEQHSYEANIPEINEMFFKGFLAK